MKTATVLRTIVLPVGLLGVIALAIACDNGPTGSTPPPDGLTSPQAGDTFLLGDSMTVAWRSAQLQETDKVSILMKNDDTTVTVAENVQGITGQKTGSYRFFIYDSLIYDLDAFSMNYVVAVESEALDTTYATESPISLSFGMLTPDGTESYRVGETIHISWVWSWYHTFDNQAVLRFSNDDGLSWEVIVPHGMNYDEHYRGSFDWVIPDTLPDLGISPVGDNCYIQAGPYSGDITLFNFKSAPFAVQAASE